jgi:hypothetical protein
MQWLGSRVGGSGGLPVTEASASALTCVLAFPVPADRHIDRLSEALAIDPSLVLWAACQASAPPEGGWTIPQLALSIAERPGELSAAASRGQHPVEFSPRTAARLARWAGKCAAVSELAAGDGTANSQTLKHFRVWGMLHAAREMQEEASVAGELPGWLQAFLDSLFGPSSQDSPPHVAAVRRAIRLWNNAGELPAPAGCRWSEVEDRARMARDQWMIGAGAPPWLREAGRRWALAVDQAAGAPSGDALAALAEFAAGAGHEINNPLAVISGRAQLLLLDEPRAERRRDLAAIQGQAMRIHEMIADLMLMARPPQPEPTWVEAGALLTELATGLAPLIERSRAVLRMQSQPGQTVWADRSQLASAVRAILQNAVEAVEPGGRVEVVVESAGDPAEGGTLIWIRDNGTGIPKEVLPRVFDPFFSGRSAGRGLGMGLCKAHRIVGLHGGTISLSSSRDAGTEVRTFWPAPGSVQPPQSS